MFTRMGGSRLRLGVIGRAHGLAGGLRIQVDNPRSEALAALVRARGLVYCDGQPRRLLQASPAGPERHVGGPRPWLVRLAEVSSRDEAEALLGQVVEADREALPPLDEDEFYYEDLVGLECVDDSGAALGVVARLYETGAADVLVVKEPAGGERELPFVDDYVLRVDLGQRQVVLRLPEEEVVEPG